MDLSGICVPELEADNRAEVIRESVGMSYYSLLFFYGFRLKAD